MSDARRKIEQVFAAEMHRLGYRFAYGRTPADFERQYAKQRANKRRRDRRR